MKKKISVLFLALMLAFVSVACGTNAVADESSEQTVKAPQSIQNEKDLKVHFLDVGQADCTLIQLPNGEEIMIDAGNTGDADYIIRYLENLQVDDIEYLILTHPHEDHIGSAEKIINSLNVNKVYMPDIEATSNLYKNTMLAIENSKCTEIIYAKPGLMITETQDMKFEILAPKSMYYSELNEYSAVTKLDYLEISFIFTGDAESVSELEMIQGGCDLDSDLLKVGHHGGRTSTSKDFLQAVTPKYSVISCGEDNSYGHPHIETLNRLSGIGSEIYRTDKLGTIVAVSDGQSITFSSNP